MLAKAARACRVPSALCQFREAASGIRSVRLMTDRTSPHAITEHGQHEANGKGPSTDRQARLHRIWLGHSRCVQRRGHDVAHWDYEPQSLRQTGRISHLHPEQCGNKTADNTITRHKTAVDETPCVAYVPLTDPVFIRLHHCPANRQKQLKTGGWGAFKASFARASTANFWGLRTSEPPAVQLTRACDTRQPEPSAAFTVTSQRTMAQ